MSEIWYAYALIGNKVVGNIDVEKMVIGKKSRSEINDYPLDHATLHKDCKRTRVKEEFLSSKCVTKKFLTFFETFCEIDPNSKHYLKAVVPKVCSADH